jgi:HlyD family secretion protein
MKQIKKARTNRLREEVQDFSPRILNLMHQPPTPMPGVVMRIIIIFFIVLLSWAAISELDIVARAEGKLIPQTHLKVVQPFEDGRIEKILVQEGQTVKKGQPLLLMDTRFSQSDTNKIEADLAMARLQLRRIDAELAIRPFRLKDQDEKAMFNAVKSQLTAHQQAHQSSLAEQSAVLEQSQKQLKAKTVELKKLQELLPIQKEAEAKYIKLSKEGYAANLQVLEKKQARIEVENDLKSQQFIIESLEAQIREAKEKLQSIKSNYQQKLYDEKAQVRQQLIQLEQEQDKQHYRNTLMELKAPQDGVVMELATHTEGTVIPSGSVVMRLVPQNDPLKAEVYVNNQDVGFIASGQTARVKLASYQFQKFGMINGTVERISADAIEPKEVNETQALTYKTLLVLNQQQLERDGRVFDLRSGMHVTAEIMLGKRTVLEYLLSPIQKTISEAGTER